MLDETLVGAIMYYVWIRNAPELAKRINKYSFIGFGLWLIIIIFIIAMYSVLLDI